MARLLWGALRTLGWMLLLLLLASAVVAVLRASAIDDAGRAARALLEIPAAEVVGSNGFAALMFSGHDVPAERVEAVFAEDVAAFSAWRARLDEETLFWASDKSDVSQPAESYLPLVGRGFSERLPAPSDDVCALGAPGCLALVREHADAVGAILDVHRDRLAGVERALAADHVVNAYPVAVGSPVPPYGGFRLPLTAAAFDAVQGRVPQAVARTCGLLANARRMDRQGRNLVEKLMAQALAQGAAWLLLDLRREFPVAILPASCADALAPVDTDEAMVCEAMRGEYRMHRALGAQLDGHLAGWKPMAVMTRLLLFDDDLQAVWSAREFAPYCGDDVRELAEAGLPSPAPAQAIGFDRVVCYAAYINCVLAQIAGPSFAGYGDRALDHAAILRLLLAAQRVADGALAPVEAADAASTPGYPVDFDPAAQRATIRLRAPRDRDAPTLHVDFAPLLPGRNPEPETTDAPETTLHASVGAAIGKRSIILWR